MHIALSRAYVHLYAIRKRERRTGATSITKTQAQKHKSTKVQSAKHKAQKHKSKCKADSKHVKAQKCKRADRLTGMLAAVVHGT